MSKVKNYEVATNQKFVNIGKLKGKNVTVTDNSDMGNIYTVKVRKKKFASTTILKTLKKIQS